MSSSGLEYKFIAAIAMIICWESKRLKWFDIDKAFAWRKQGTE